MGIGLAFGKKNRYITSVSIHPVETVTWDDAVAFCNRLNELYANKVPAGYRFDLPTKTRWEYAAQGGNKSRRYKYSGSDNPDDVAWHLNNSGGKTHPVAKAGAKTVAMNGIRCDSRPDMNIRPEAYQKRFVEEYVAGHPDAFDTVYLVDLRGGFNQCQP